MNDSRTATAERAAQLLARPYAINGLDLRNRVVMAPMTREFSPGGVPTADVAAYYARRAAGGVGLIVTEGTYVGHESTWASDNVPRFHGDEQLAGWQRVAEAVHAAGGTILPQLWHVGAARDPGTGPVPDADVLSPSGLGLDGSPKGRAMTQDDIDAVVAAFAESAAAAERLGFDGVELHGAHGYLIDEFLWASTNRRTDAYGGDLASRTRFAAEVVAAVRAAVSPDFPVTFRFSQWKGGAYDARLAETPGELEQVLAPLAAAGVDAFHASTRRYWLPEFDGSDLNLAGWTKKLTGKPVISVGSVGLDKEFMGPEGMAFQPGTTGIEKLLDRMEDDEFDMIAVGRSLIADPEWPSRITKGEKTNPFSAELLGALH
ncbi:NADH:flavin oxidoreductase [Glycomyces algeriensis]|uniref:Oxidoreductase n=2 Tax=Glycomyces algeriensis TaxID=256037 RepID=A0A9W6LG10_9ACTN|nr:NADH:flavin oxidoreductase [Glycomyces algeriensis]MDA1367155.1 NADH:flavin oxidoreductase [Glycomyces algeriensis]GLI41161.1 oxidoreductase [Glycomyces algeriensis]